jgi:predicted metal-binding protein
MKPEVLVKEITGKLVITEKTREWCKRPYKYHSGGCPNFGRELKCPPYAPMVNDFIDLEKKHWFVIVRFKFENQKEKIEMVESSMTKYKVRCVPFWGDEIKEILTRACVEFTIKRMGMRVMKLVHTLLPEAMGVNTVKTVLKLDLPVMKNIENSMYKIALVGYRK